MARIILNNIILYYSNFFQSKSILVPLDTKKRYGTPFVENQKYFEIYLTLK